MKVRKPTDYSRSNASYSFNITWNQDFIDDINNRLRNVVLGVAEYSKDIMNKEYVPEKTGALVDSAEIELINDNIVDIIWRAPYAVEAYYNKEDKLEKKKGAFWFDRMITDYQTRIEKEARRIYKGVSK